MLTPPLLVTGVPLSTSTTPQPVRKERKAKLIWVLVKTIYKHQVKALPVAFLLSSSSQDGKNVKCTECTWDYTCHVKYILLWKHLVSSRSVSTSTESSKPGNEWVMKPVPPQSSWTPYCTSLYPEASLQTLAQFVLNKAGVQLGRMFQFYSSIHQDPGSLAATGPNQTPSFLKWPFISHGSQ